MLQSFLTVGQQILTLYLLLVVGFFLGWRYRLVGPNLGRSQMERSSCWMTAPRWP